MRLVNLSSSSSSHWESQTEGERVRQRERSRLSPQKQLQLAVQTSFTSRREGKTWILGPWWHFFTRNLEAWDRSSADCPTFPPSPGEIVTHRPITLQAKNAIFQHKFLEQKRPGRVSYRLGTEKSGHAVHQPRASEMPSLWLTQGPRNWHGQRPRNMPNQRPTNGHTKRPTQGPGKSPAISPVKGRLTGWVKDRI